MKWRTARLAELLKPVSRPVAIVPGERYRLLGAQWYAKGLFEREEKDGSEIRAQTLYEVKEWDFVYNRLFAWKGSFALATATDEGGLVSNEFPSFVADRNVIEPTWLRWYFAQESVWEKAMELSAGGTPTSRNRLKEEAFLSMRIPLPSLPEQHLIVARLEELAARIGETKRLQEETQQSIHTVLQTKFQQLVLNTRLMLMAEVAPLERRPIQVVPDKPYAELGIRSFGKGTFHKSEVLGFELGDKRVFMIKPRDLLFNVVFAWEGAVAVAQPRDEGRVGSHRFLTCVPKSGLATAEFLRFYFLTRDGLEKLGNASPGGAGRNRTLGIDALAGISVPVPPYRQQIHFDALQRKFSEIASIRAGVDQTSAAILSSSLARMLN